MQQYFQINLFNDDGAFNAAPMEEMLNKGRDHFFIFFPRIIELKEIVRLNEFLNAHPDIKLCVHDKTMLHRENLNFLGRNMAFYTMLNRNHFHIENVSYHMGSMYGFGGHAQQDLLATLLKLKIDRVQDKERFFCSTFSASDYHSFIHDRVPVLKDLVKAASEFNIGVLVKNLCLDYLMTGREQAPKFEQNGYDIEWFNEQFGILPILVEKGDFPRHTKEMVGLRRQTGAGISMDMEYMRYLVLLSRRYNMNNQTMVDLWDISLSKDEKKILEEKGFIIQEGKPIFFEKEIDIYEQIFLLKNKVHIAHLSGSIGPVFVDKKLLKPEDITDDLLLGILSDDNIPFASMGKKQLSSFDGFDDVTNQRNFKYDAPQQIWETIFKKQFLEDIFLLKEIGCSRIVQKMKGFSEKAAETFQMFNNLTDLDLV